jgi:hypothetical protein
MDSVATLKANTKRLLKRFDPTEQEARAAVRCSSLSGSQASLATNRAGGSGSGTVLSFLASNQAL